VVSELQAWNEAEGGKLDIAKLTKAAVNWCLQDFSALLNAEYKHPDESRIAPENFAELLKLIEQGKISTTAAKQVFKVMFEKGGEPESIMEDLGLAQVSDEGAILQVIEQVIAANEKAVQDFKAGQEKSFGFLVGQAMKELKGKGNPSMVNDLLRKALTK
jgi:aspartyl-tRNA(Asn)/glutamyl-tRNA(Gln) amidotransferase subunit B